MIGVVEIFYAENGAAEMCQCKQLGEMQKCKTDVRKNYATNAHGRPILES
jgi:hypothetical protein